MDNRTEKPDRFLSPEEIEKKSFRILESLMGDYSGTAEEREVVLRIAHATTDVEWAKTFLFSPGAVESDYRGHRRGAPSLPTWKWYGQES